MASNAAFPRPSTEDCMKLALETRCSVATVRNWYGRRRLSRGQRWHLEQAAERLGMWLPAEPFPGWEGEESARLAQQRGEGTAGWVPGSGYKAEAVA